MALINCPECGHEVSTSAKACPVCGFPVARKELFKKAATSIKHVFQRRQLPPAQPGTVHLIDAATTHELTGGMAKTRGPFNLYRINGCGMGMAGFLPVVMVDGRVIGLSLSSVCFLFIPLIPCAWYMVERNGNRYTFYGRVPLRVCSSVFGSGFIWKSYLIEIAKPSAIIAVLLAAVVALG
ncbi:zinc-ribbon domain-containing protein [Burkholderia ambifaria]|uniref:zinc-ribbon domain-containing protein n=1 Tax=Burkholderia ambifaria TaxID=152480 RepID=UPI00158C9180|nr:zinc ribbon domain-containing protein [Burkholderia ambifaria]